MTCRCSTTAEHNARAAETDAYYAQTQRDAKDRKAAQKIALLKSRTPNPNEYEIEDMVRIGSHVVMRVKYPSCTACSFEGSKIMVLLDVAEREVVRWRRIDPHFRGPEELPPTSAPSPAARFPGTDVGWLDAINYATGKS